MSCWPSRTATSSPNDAEKIGSASVLLGAGRQKKGDPLDFAAGIALHKKRGDYRPQGREPRHLLRRSRTSSPPPRKSTAAASSTAPTKPEEAPLVYALVTKDGVERYDQ